MMMMMMIQDDPTDSEAKYAKSRSLQGCTVFGRGLKDKI